jgi:signal transduction histidine kinase
MSSSTSSPYDDDERTIVLYDVDDIAKSALENFSRLKISMDTCVGDDGAALTVNATPIWEGLMTLKNKGVKIRWITDITKENLKWCREVMRISEMRHLDNIKGAFGIHDGKYYLASANVTKQGRIFPGELIISNVKVVVEQQQQVFNLLWDKAIPAKQRIKEIEQDLKREFIDTYRDPLDILNLIFTILKSATSDIQVLFSSHYAFYKLVNIGVLETLKNSAFQQGLEVKVLVNVENETEIINIKELLSEKKGSSEQRLSINFLPLSNKFLKTMITTFIVDSIFSLTLEIKDIGTNDNLEESLGMATYSNSRATVLSYVSIFESFWIQSELVKKLKKSEELEKDFVHIAAHEFKNPIQPILGLSDFMMNNKLDENLFRNSLRIINRNAKKLIQLTNDILDVTKIETNNLNLHKEVFNLSVLVTDIIEDYGNQIDKENITLSAKFQYSNKDHEKGNYEDDKINESEYDIHLHADRNRINQVISNLLNNAIKFTNKGCISIMLEKKYPENEMFVSVKDTGYGIDQSILSKLFSKFASKSKEGTGLGLYISKNIIESHGGKIWAKNNEDGKGATFSFSLPFDS